MSFRFEAPSTSGPAPNSTKSPAAAPGGIFNTGLTFSFMPQGGAGGDSTTPTSNTTLFGAVNDNGVQKPAGGLLGGVATSTTPKTSVEGLFGRNPTKPATSVFGEANATTSAPSTGASFGAASNVFFKNNNNTSTPSSTTAGGMFGVQNNANKTPGTAATSSDPASGLFANSGNAFYGKKNSTTPSTLGLSLTAATPAKPLSLTSTTPVGAPPTGSSSKSTVSGFLGNNASNQQTSVFFGGASAKTSSSTSPTLASQPATTAPGGSGLLSGGQTGTGNMFGAKPTANATPVSGGLFGSTKNNNSTHPTSSTPAATPASAGTTSLFGTKPAAPAATPAIGAASTGGLFGNAPTTSTSVSSGSVQAPTAAGGLFGAKPAATSTTSSAAPASAAKTNNIFGTATQSSTASAAKTAGSLFGAPASTSQPATTTAATTTANTTTPAAASGGMFGAKPASDNKDKDEARPAAIGATSMMGASTTGPPSQMARLKNKTMEDIVTRWASDLSKYQKEFKEQATIVSNWDRNLVDNGEKIQKLYLDTFEAERASHEIERQLAAVESQQEELEAWLNRYESEVQDMFAKQMGAGEQLGGPDQERERTYKLAEKLTQQLDEKSRDLSKMVQEINDISGTLSKGAKAEDPLSQIVRVLNGHLTQLQWIDANSSALQAKVTAAQKFNSNLGSHYAGGESDVAESFYRSYMGRR